MPELTAALAVALAIMVSLNAYVLLAGADFGGGVWDLLATGPRRNQQRRLIADAMGPVWEANHVWLILVVVLLIFGPRRLPDMVKGLGQSVRGHRAAEPGPYDDGVSVVGYRRAG